MRERSRGLVSGLLVLCLLLAPVQGRSELCTIDAVPAATLLLPYFAVDLDACDAASGGQTTFFNVNNASAAPVLAHVVLWTDWSVPALDFNVSLTGYDVHTINLRDVFCTGRVPLGGSLSLDLDAATRQHLGEWFAGRPSSRFDTCAGAPRSDHVATGYVTIDVVTDNVSGSPADGTPYFAKIAFDNVLWGTWYIETYATREEPVPCESCLGLKRKKKRRCRKAQRRCADNPQTTTVTVKQVSAAPLVSVEAADTAFTTGQRTFYGRYIGGSAIDKREPLPNTFGVEYPQVDAPADYDLIVWREGSDSSAPVPCGSEPSWFPLQLTQVVAFDDAEDAAEVDIPLPLETQRRTGVLDALPFPRGWMYLNLAHPGASDPAGGQAWVVRVRENRLDPAGVVQFATGCSQ